MTSTQVKNAHYSGVLMRTVPVFALLAVVLYAVDFVPEPYETVATAVAPVVEPAYVPAADEVVHRIPTHVAVRSIDVDTPVMAPESTDIEVLDRALLLGAVYYPGSGILGENGNVLLFGHSSYLPVVKNKAFQAFNEVGKLKPGEEIVVTSDTHVFTYRITNVRMAKAEQTLIPFKADKPLLTLVSCNTFGAKEDRWVVTAEQTSVAPRAGLSEEP